MLVFFGTIPSVTLAATLYVSQSSDNPMPPYSTWSTAAETVQEAVDVASNGDTVLVAAGEYLLSSQIIVGKAVLIRSQSGRTLTVLSGQGSTRCLRITNSLAVLDGFTIQNGNSANEVDTTRGGGVYLTGATVRNCIITNCSTFPESDSGGGIYMSGGTLSNTVVIGNGASSAQGQGGGVYCGGGGLVVNCQILQNRSEYAGAGVYLVQSQIRNSIASDNRGEERGAGIYAQVSTVLDCVISNNIFDGVYRPHVGGGVFLTGSELDRSVVVNNRAGSLYPGRGGGIFATNSVVRNSLITGNTAQADAFGGDPGLGGGIYLQGGSVVNCTLAANSTEDASDGPGTGGGIYVESGRATNVICYFNTSTSNANWYAGAGTFYYTCTTPLPGGSGNTSANPLFADTMAGNYRLQGGSPCRNTGLNQAWMASAKDLDGNSRVIGGTVDMGAYEYSIVATPTISPNGGSFADSVLITLSCTTSNAVIHYTTDGSNPTAGSPVYAGPFTRYNSVAIKAMAVRSGYANSAIASASFTVTPSAPRTIYVKQDSPSPAPPYDSWNTAAHTIQEAVDTASDGDTVLVSNGTYFASPKLIITKRIVLRSVFGAISTVLDGEEANRCLWVSNALAVVDGFTIKNGAAFWSSPGDGGDPGDGGGVYLVGGVVRNCIITNCVADWISGRAGGGIYMAGGSLTDSIIHGNGKPIGQGSGGGVYCGGGGRIERCQIQNNRSEYPGGGIYVIDSFVTDSVIAHNEGADYGAGIYSRSSTVTGCVISNNLLSGEYGFGPDGGGVYLDGGELNRCALISNAAGRYSGRAGYGGGVFCTNGVVRNTLIALNYARDPGSDDAGRGGGVYLRGGSLLNCTIVGNVGEQGTNFQASASLGGGVFLESGEVTNVICYFNTATLNANWHNMSGSFAYSCTTPDPGGIGNITTDPQFVNHAAGDYRLLLSSPCIDAGTNQSWMAGTADLSGGPRILNARVDMGAYEHLGLGIPLIFVNGELSPSNSFVLSSAANIEISSTFGNHGIRYTLDGSDPVNGAIYSGGFIVQQSVVVRALAYSSDFLQTAEADPLSIIIMAPPVIVSSPLSQIVTAGESVTFEVAAEGSAVLTYRWQLNGADIAGATNASLTLADIEVFNAGDYRVLVSNPFGVAASEIATLTVLQAPMFTTQPGSVATPIGSNVTFYAVASGTPPLLFQWRVNGVNIAGATNDFLTISNVQPAHGGTYSAVVANEAGVSASNPAELVVQVPFFQAGDFFTNTILLATSPVRTTNQGATREFGEPTHAGKFGSNSVWYAWTAPSNGIATFETSGSTFDTLLAVYTGSSLGSLTLVGSDEDRGGFLASRVQFNAVSNTTYRIAIDGFAGGQGTCLVSWRLEPTAQVLPVITNQPRSVTVLEGDSAQFSVGAVGTGLRYQWLFDGSALIGQTNSFLNVTDIQAEQVGYYSVRIGNSALRFVESLPATLEIGPVRGVQSQDKAPALEDIAGQGGGGFASGLAKAATVASSSAFISVALGTISYQIMNSTNSTVAAIGGSLECGVIGQGARWITITAGDDGTLILDTAGSEVKTLLVVYEVRPTGYVYMACNHNGTMSRLSIAARANRQYMVAVDRVGATTGRLRLTWSLGRPPVIASEPQHAIALVGSTVVLTSLATNWVAPSFENALSIPEPTYQWRRGATNIPGATSATLTMANIQLSEARNYRVEAANAFGSVTSAAVRVEVVALGRPSSPYVRVGGETLLSVVTALTNCPTAYRWARDNSILSGRTEPKLTLSNVQLADQGEYSVMLDTCIGTYFFVVADLVVGSPPAIRADSRYQFVPLGGSVTLGVDVSDERCPLTYAWEHNGERGLGTGPSLTLTDVQPSDAGLYRVIVSNCFGSATSEDMKVAVGMPLQFAARIEGANLVLTWQAEAGQTYQVQYKDDLNHPDWTTLGTETANTAGTITLQEDITQHPQRFYRVVVSMGSADF